VFHQDFVTTLTTASSAYTETESTNTSLLCPQGVPNLLHRPGGLSTPQLGSVLGAGNWKPGSLLRQVTANQKGYLHTIITSLQNSFNDFWKNIKALPAAFKRALQALDKGDISTAIQAVAQGFRDLLIDGTKYVSDGAGGLRWSFTGPLADLWPILHIPGQVMQNLADLLKPLGFGLMGNLAQHAADGFNNFASGFTFQFGATTGYEKFLMGWPLALTLDILGAPIVSMQALAQSLQAAHDAVASGLPFKALFDLLGAPARMTGAFFFGSGSVQIPTGTPGYALGSMHVGGIFAPLQYQPGYPAGTQTGGIIPGLMAHVLPHLPLPLEPVAPPTLDAVADRRWDANAPTTTSSLLTADARLPFTAGGLLVGA
jgi:hypothetical protein